MLDQEPIATIQRPQRLPTDQHQLLRLVIPKVLEISSESGMLQSRHLLEQGIPLAQAARAVKLLAQAGVLGPQEDQGRTVNREHCAQLLATIGEMVVSSTIRNGTAALAAFGTSRIETGSGR